MLSFHLVASLSRHRRGWNADCANSGVLQKSPQQSSSQPFNQSTNVSTFSEVLISFTRPSMFTVSALCEELTRALASKSVLWRSDAWLSRSSSSSSIRWRWTRCVNVTISDVFVWIVLITDSLIKAAKLGEGSYFVCPSLRFSIHRLRLQSRDDVLS